MKNYKLLSGMVILLMIIGSFSSNAQSSSTGTKSNPSHVIYMPSTPSVGSTEPSSPVLVSDNGEVDQVVGVNTEEGIPSVKLIKKTGDKLQDAKAWIVSFDNWFNGTPNASTFLDAHEIALYKSGQYLDLYNYQFTKSSRK